MTFRAAVIGCLLGLAWSAPALAQDEDAAEPTVDIQAVIQTIEQATDFDDVSRAFFTARRGNAQNVELHAAFVKRAMELDNGARATDAAQFLTEHTPDDGYVWGLAAYGYARRGQFGPAINAGTRAAALLPGDPVVMTNLGQLMGWLAHQEQIPSLSDDTLRTMTANQDAWPGNPHYVQGMAMIEGGYQAYEAQRLAKAERVEELKARGQELLSKGQQLQQDLDNSRDLVRRMQNAGNPAGGNAGGEIGGGIGGDIGGGVDPAAGGGGGSGYEQQIQDERQKQQEIRAQMTATQRELTAVKREFRKAEKELEMVERRKRTLVEESGGSPQLVALSRFVPEEETTAEGTDANPDSEGLPVATGPDTRAEVIADGDDITAETSAGNWQVIDGRPVAVNGTLFHDGNQGKGENYITLQPDLPGAGRYEVYLNNFVHSQGATNVPVAIKHAGGAANVTVNQRTGGNGWILLGTYNFQAGRAGLVVIRTDGTDGYVFVDAAKFVPAN